MRGRRCRFCHGLLEVFDDGPCCLHLPPCRLGFCWRCRRITWHGRCARELLEDLDVATVSLGDRTS